MKTCMIQRESCTFLTADGHISASLNVWLISHYGIVADSTALSEKSVIILKMSWPGFRFNPDYDGFNM